MSRDPIVDEIHKVREEYARELDFDVRAICKDIQAKQLRSGRQLVSFPARKPKPRKDAASEQLRPGLAGCLNHGSV
jgi:hypothetical protein